MNIYLAKVNVKLGTGHVKIGTWDTGFTGRMTLIVKEALKNFQPLTIYRAVTIIVSDITNTTTQ